MAARPVVFVLVILCTTACLASSFIFPDDSSPSCAQVFGKKKASNLILLPEDDENDESPTTYKLLYEKDKVTVMETDQQDCHIESTETLRLALDRITGITEVLVNDDTLDPVFLTVELRLGNTPYECELTDRTVTRFGKSFTVFSCDAEANFRYANEIDITSLIPRDLNIIDYQPDGLTFDWLIVSSNRTRRSVDDGINDGINEKKSAVSFDSIKKQHCPPVRPYKGMPQSYSDYKLVIDGSINEHLLRKPCKDGFNSTGQYSEINQCKNGSWEGNGFPKCEVLRPKTPPTVDHATWSFVHEDTFHEVVYTCQDGYYLSNNTGTTVKVTYILELDNWSGIPECERPGNLHFIMDNWPILVSTAAVTLTLAVALFTLVVLVKRMTISKQQKLKNLLPEKDSSAIIRQSPFAYQDGDKKTTERQQQQKCKGTLFVGLEDAYNGLLSVNQEDTQDNNGYMTTNDLLQRNIGYERPMYEDIGGDKTKLLSSSPV